MTVSRFLTAASVVLIALACAVQVEPPRASGSVSASGRYGAAEARIFDLINAERRRQGLPALAHSEQLAQMAEIQARNMAYFQKMAHVLPEASLPTLTDRGVYVRYPFGRLAENVALGYPDAETVVQGWMNSKGHRANILNSGVVETGIAIARSSAGGLYYCQVFGQRLNAP
jgi:uncharacterized protein YkwD